MSTLFGKSWVLCKCFVFSIHYKVWEVWGQRTTYLPGFSVFLNAAVSCFGGLFSCAEASSVLYHNFCIYHVDAPGHEVSTLFHQMLLAPVTLLLQGMAVSLECIMSQNERQQESGLRQIDMCKQSRSLPSDSGVQTGITIRVALDIYWPVTCSQAGAAEIPADQPLLSVDDLADQVAEVLDYFGWVSKSISF